MIRKHASTRYSIRKNAVIGSGERLFSSSNKVLKTIRLRHNITLIDTEQNTTLKNGATVVNTWSTEEWILLGVDPTERVAFFEASDSWLLAKLDLETGSFQPDDDPLFIQYELNVDDSGTFVQDEISTEKFYLKR